MNLHAIRAIYRFEMARTWRTVTQSIISPVLSTALYFVVFGSAIGSRIQQIGDVSYGAFIVPGLIMLSVLTQSIFEKLQLIPMLVVMPLTFLGGPFYSISMLPPLWQKLSMLNPSVYLISGFRWSLFDTVEMHVRLSFSMTLLFFLVSLAIATWIMKTGWRLKA